MSPERKITGYEYNPSLSFEWEPESLNTTDITIQLRFNNTSDIGKERELL
jgi:hypothetical protein